MKTCCRLFCKKGRVNKMVFLRCPYYSASISQENNIGITGNVLFGELLY